MALPKIETPTYELDLPSEDRKIKFRPFTVKEEKVLLIANESKNSSELLNATINVIEACTFNEIDAIKSPLFDIEYIFLQLRAKSVGEMAKLRVLCPDDKETYTEVEVNLEDVQVQVEEGHTNKIELGDGMGMIMTYPNIDTFKNSGITEIKADNMIDVISTCILQIYEDDGKKVYETKDQTKKELSEFLEQLQTIHFRKVQAFFETVPKLKHTIKVKNPKTKKESEIVLAGLNDLLQ